MFLILIGIQNVPVAVSGGARKSTVLKPRISNQQYCTIENNNKISMQFPVTLRFLNAFHYVK